MKALRRHSGISLFIQVSYLVFFISFIFSFRAVTSISTAAILVGGIMEYRSRSKSLFQSMHVFVVLCVIFFLLQVVAMLYTSDAKAGWSNVRLKSGLVFIPLGVYLSTRFMGPSVRKRLLAWYCVILSAATLYCLAIACKNYLQQHDSEVFFYHKLVSPVSNHAVYFSVFVVIALIWLLDGLLRRDLIFNKLLHLLMVIYLSVVLLLLSSKLVIAFYAVCLLYYFILFFRERKAWRKWMIALFIAFIAGTCMLLLTRNPVSNRFKDIMHGDIGFVMQDRFDKADYFNGIQFRLLQWRLTAEILSDNDAWQYGVGPGDDQALLNEQYISKNMYTGVPAEKGRRGYLDYNSHNQLLQSLLQTGIPGAIVFLVITFILGAMVWKSRNRVFSLVVLLLIIYSLIESVFETQYGILFYTFFPLFLNYSHARNTSHINTRVSRE